MQPCVQCVHQTCSAICLRDFGYQRQQYTITRKEWLCHAEAGGAIPASSNRITFRCPWPTTTHWSSLNLDWFGHVEWILEDSWHKPVSHSEVPGRCPESQPWKKMGQQLLFEYRPWPACWCLFTWCNVNKLSHMTQKVNPAPCSVLLDYLQSPFWPHIVSCGNASICSCHFHIDSFHISEDPLSRQLSLMLSSLDFQMNCVEA